MNVTTFSRSTSACGEPINLTEVGVLASTKVQSCSPFFTRYPHPMENSRGATAPISRIKVSAKVKTFVLDTNVLLHDPQSVFKFEDNNLDIPVEVLEELDAIKGEQSTERGRNARRVHRILQGLLPDARAMHEGVELDYGGTVSIIINP